MTGRDEHEAAIEYYRSTAAAAAVAWRDLDQARQRRDEIVNREMAREADTPVDPFSASIRGINTERRVRMSPEYLVAVNDVRHLQMLLFDRATEEAIAATRMRRLERV